MSMEVKMRKIWMILLAGILGMVASTQSVKAACDTGTPPPNTDFFE